MIDSQLPEAVVSPGNYQEVAGVMRYANKMRLGVIPFGRGEYKGVGNAPRRYDVALSVARLNRIIEHEPADLTVTCEAGIGLGDISQPLRATAQMTPFGTAVPGGPSIGKLLATNGFGNLLYGSPRDFTLGMRVVTADGSITRAGGRVVKNVAGYDLCKLHIGAMGTLGVIVEATLRAAPLPISEEEVRLESPSVAEACSAAIELHRRGVPLWKASIRKARFGEAPGSPPAVVYILSLDLRGSSAGVRRSLAEIERIQGHGIRPVASNRDTADEVDYGLPPRPPASDLLECEASVIPSRVPELVGTIERAAPNASLRVLPIRGIVNAAVWAPNPEGILQELRSASTRAGGRFVVIQCHPDLKRRIDVFGDVPPKTLELMRRIKQQFDPNGILSPGRFVGRI
jgi:glycolate oxidase FAD binding subunit